MHILRIENREINSYPEEFRQRLRDFSEDGTHTEAPSLITAIFHACDKDMEKVCGLISLELEDDISRAGFKLDYDKYMDAYILRSKCNMKEFEVEVGFISAITRVYKGLRAANSAVAYLKAMGYGVQRAGVLDQKDKRLSDVEDRTSKIEYALSNLKSPVIESIKEDIASINRRLEKLASIFHEDETGFFIESKAIHPMLQKELVELKSRVVKLEPAIDTLNNKIGALRETLSAERKVAVEEKGKTEEDRADVH